MESSFPSNQGGDLLHRNQLKMWMKRKMILKKKKKVWMLKRKKTRMLKRKKSRQQHCEQFNMEMVMINCFPSASGFTCQWSGEDDPPVQSDVPLQELIKNQGLNSTSREDYGLFRVSSSTVSELGLDPDEMCVNVEEHRRPRTGWRPRARKFSGDTASRSDVPPLELIKMRNLNSTTDYPPPVPPSGEGGSETKPSGSKWNIFQGCLGKNK